MALESGKYGPDSIIDSAPQNFIVPNSGGKEHFIVHNFGNTYSGPITLQDATDISDNTVYSQVGINVGTKKIAHFAKRAGHPHPGLGQLRDDPRRAEDRGVAARHGPRLRDVRRGRPEGVRPGARGPGQGADGDRADLLPEGVPAARTRSISPQYERVLPASIAAVVHEMLTGVVQSGTGTSAAISGVDVAGKTGTTTNYADAWFVGWTPQLTTAVWVGYPNKLVPMTTDYNGAPVEGGTYPAIIWHNFMVQALQILATENPHAEDHDRRRRLTRPARRRSRTRGSGTGTDTTATTPDGADRRRRPAETPVAAATGTGGGATGNGGAGSRRWRRGRHDRRRWRDDGRWRRHRCDRRRRRRHDRRRRRRWRCRRHDGRRRVRLGWRRTRRRASGCYATLVATARGATGSGCRARRSATANRRPS